MKQASSASGSCPVSSGLASNNDTHFRESKSFGLSAVNAFQLIHYQSHSPACRSPAGRNSSDIVGSLTNSDGDHFYSRGMRSVVQERNVQH